MIKQLYVICFWLLLCVHKLWFSDSLNYVKHVLETLSQPRLHNVYTFTQLYSIVKILHPKWNEKTKQNKT